MKEIVNFIDTFLESPLQLVLIFVCLAIFLWWFIKERPANNKAQKELVNRVLQESEKNKESEEREREKFFKVMDDYRVQTEKTSALYDKALDNSTKAIENNTEVIKNQNIRSELMNQSLRNLIESTGRIEEKVDRLDIEQRDLISKAQEVVILVRDAHE